MRWYVNKRGETQGPIEEAELVDSIKRGILGEDCHIRDEESGNWSPIASSPFASFLPRASKSGESETLGTAIVLMPFVAFALIVFWVGQMNLFQSPAQFLMIIGWGTIATTAALTYVDAKAVGAGGPNDLDKKGRKRSGPVAWLFAVLLLWVLAYPAWLFQRRHYGRRNLLVGGLVSAALFLGGWFVMGAAIDTKASQVRQALTTFGGVEAPSTPAMPADRAPAATPTVTRAKYEKIATGMTHDDVTTIIGNPGQEISRSDLAGIETAMYQWTNPGGSNMNAMFQDGKLVNKAQFGLK